MESKGKVLAIVVAGLLIAASCKKLVSLADIKFSVPLSQKANVDGLPNSPFVPPNEGLKASIPAIPVATEYEKNLKENNTNADLIKHVYLGALNLRVDEPQSQTFNLVDSIWLHMSAKGMPEILAAHKFGIPKDIRYLELETTDEDIRNYFVQDTVYFRLEGRFYNAPDSASVFTVGGKFDVVANPLEK